MSDSGGKLKRRDFISTTVKTASIVAAGSGLMPTMARSHSKRPPNVVIIMADDMGWGDLGCYGARAIETPNIDRMATEGVRMTDFFSSAAVCSPSRAGLLTGRYPPRTNITAVLFPTKTPAGIGWRAVTRTPKGLPLDEITIAEAVKPYGYRTHCVGKWHLGDQKKYRPHRRGFDNFDGVLYSNDMKPFELYHNDEVVDDNPADQTKLTEAYTKSAVNFIDDAGKDPFFLYVAHTFPHVPLHASDRFRGHSRGGLYGDAIEEIDWSTGEIMQALARNGIDENTLVFFTSDNGPWLEGSTGGARGRKAETLDGGMRVPGIARWPGRIPAGRVIDEPCMNIDLMPMTLDAAGIPLPEDRAIDGCSILPLLEGWTDKTPHDALFYYWNRDLQGVRVGRWKYFRKHRLWMYPPRMTGPWLIDTDEDPYESYNAMIKHPDVAKRMEKIMADWEANFDRGINR